MDLVPEILGAVPGVTEQSPGSGEPVGFFSRETHLELSWESSPCA